MAAYPRRPRNDTTRPDSACPEMARRDASRPQDGQQQPAQGVGPGAGSNSNSNSNSSRSPTNSRNNEHEGPIPKSNLRISYGIGYRKGAMGHEKAAEEGDYATAAERREAIKAGKAEDNAERERVKKMTDKDMIQYRGEWLRIWMTVASANQSPQAGAQGTTV
ncbi:hypothetical protein [Streptomyces sp. N2A]|uniref:hypothetical protein n=1 Tax=Streptomyces sp. N2A TaxID=3073936 RepID=UPI00286FBB02|nr:hypothetical protein [Streptomyces sp. N2A]